MDSLPRDVWIHIKNVVLDFVTNAEDPNRPMTRVYGEYYGRALRRAAGWSLCPATRWGNGSNFPKHSDAAKNPLSFRPTPGSGGLAR